MDTRSRDRRTAVALIYYKLGGRFAAWEQPKTLTEELRAAFRLLR